MITDHIALKWLNGLKDPQGRLARWALKLQQHRFQILHRPGKQNAVADALSRVHEGGIDLISVDHNQLEPWYKKMVSRVEEEPGNYPSWKTESGVLWKLDPGKRGILNGAPTWKLVIPKSQRRDALWECHDSPLSGHLGIFKTLQRLKLYYYWPGMATDTARYVNKCEVCLAHKPVQRAPAGTLGEQRIVDRPWQMVSADLMGPLPISTDRKRFIVAFTDCFTNYSVIVPVRNTTAKVVTDLLEKEVFLKFGVPQILICDNGPQFKSHIFKKKAEEYQVKIWFTPNYHPQANPMERPNRVIKTLLASYVTDNQRKWDKELPKLAFALQTAVHEVTGFSPAFLNFGRNLPRSGREYPTLEGEDVPEIVSRKNHADSLNNLPVIFDEVKDRIAEAYERSRKQYNLRRRDVEFSVGDIVWRKKQVVSDASQYITSKLAPRFEKCRISKKLGRVVYLLEDLNGRPLGSWHVKDLKSHSP